MKQKKSEILLYSAVGVAVMFFIVVAFNVIAAQFKTRLDLSEDRLYTLSPGTKAILGKLDGPVELRLYATRGEGRGPSALRTYVQSVEDLLNEMKQAGRGNIVIKKFDPQPDSEAEDLANLDGIEPQMDPASGEQFYLGLTVSQDPLKVSLPLAPTRERLLEYDVARAIAQVMSTNKPVIGVMTPLPVFGVQMPPQMMMQMGRQANQEPWVFISELKRDFDVRQVPMETEKIDDDIKVLLVVHPKDIKDTALYAIDQFIMRGGKLVAALDAMCLMDQQRSNPMMPMPSAPSNLEKLLKAWGLTYETGKIVADMNYARQLRGPNGQAQLMPTYLFLTKAAIDRTNVVTGQIDELLLPAAGHYTGEPVSGLKAEVLLRSSTNAALADTMEAQFSPQKIVDDFKSAGKSFQLGLRLTGQFKTAFPDGKPKSEADADKKDEKKEEKKDDGTLKQSKGENTVTLFADADWLSDQASVEVLNFLGQKVLRPRNGNLSLAQNLAEQLAGDESLIAIRSRGTLNRPFTVINEIQAKARDRYQEQIGRLQKEQEETQQRVNELQGKKEAGQKFVLSKDQMDEIEKFRTKAAESRKKLREVRRDLRQDVSALETRLKWINIAAVPVLVAIVGLALAVVRKQKTKAR